MRDRKRTNGKKFHNKRRKKKTTKKNKNKVTITTLLITLLLILSVSSILSPTVQAVDLTSMQKGLAISKDVLGFDTNENTTLKQLSQNSYKDVIQQENILISFGTNQNKLDMIQTFADGELRKIYVLEPKGNPELTDLSYESFQVGDDTFYNNIFNEVKHAKEFLSEYNSYTEKSIYNTIATTLNSVKADKNETTISGNIKFEIIVTEKAKTFRWTYVNNGVEAPSKCVIFGYEDGYLKYFIDNWDLYTIGSTQINTSEKKAIEIAMEASESFSWNMGSGENKAAIKDFTVANAMLWETVFCSSLYADEFRSEDALTLYPIHHIWVSLDKFYPGNVYGFNVYVWADTGEVCAINERVFTMDPPIDMIATSNEFSVVPINAFQQTEEIELNSYSVPWFSLPVLAFGMLSFGSTGLLLSRKKKGKDFSFKFVTVLFCFLMVSMILISPSPTVKATEITRRALIWGAESTGGTNSSLGYTMRKTSGEISQQQSVCANIEDYFDDNGYSADNWQGDGSIKKYILLNISDAESNYANVAVVDFNHGVGRSDTYEDGSGNWHYHFEDNVGPILDQTTGTYPENSSDPEDWTNKHMVYDMEIYTNTTENNTFFAFINTCMSANITDWESGGIGPDPAQGLNNNSKAVGMPFAWTHRTVEDKNALGGLFDEDDHISDDGYTYADNGDYCYLGFPYGSAALDQTIESGFPKYAEWVDLFFWYALNFDISINNALNEASLDLYENKFGDTDLGTDFDALWPMYNTKINDWSDTGYGNCELVVYGNGNIHLFEYFIDEYDRYSGYGVFSVTNPSNIEGGSNDGNDAILEADFFEPYQIPAQAMIVGKTGWDATGHVYLYGKTASGYSSKVQVWVSMDDSTYYQVGTEKTVTSTSDHWIDIGTYSNDFRYISVVCYADANFEKSKLYIDSVRIIPDPSDWSTTDTYYIETSSEFEDGGTVDNNAYIRGLAIDGDEAHIHCSSNGDMAQIKGNFSDDISTGHIRLYGHSDTYDSDLYVYVSNDYSNWYQVGSMLTLSDSEDSEWIELGQYYSAFKYIAIVGYNTGTQVCLYFDCARVFVYS